MHTPLKSLTLSVLLAGLLAGAAQAQRFDFVHRQTGQPLSGTILELGNSEVQINTGASNQRVDVADIEKITFASEPAELRAARDQVRIGQYEPALDNLRKIDPETLNREAIQLDYQFYEAAATANLALIGRAEPEEAIALIRDFFNKVKDDGNHHYYETIELLGDLFVVTGKFNNAAQAYGMLTNGWPELALHGKSRQARVLQMAGDYEKAAEMYSQVIAAAPNDAAGVRQESLATVGRAACMAETGQEDAAIQMVEDIIANNVADQSNVELFARAYNAMGSAYRNQGKTQEALLAFLHVDLLFNGNPDAHAEALYNLAPLWNEVRMNDRSVQARQLLRQRYSTSTWANRD